MLVRTSAVLFSLLAPTWTALLSDSSQHSSSHHSLPATSHQSFRLGSALTPASTLPLASEAALSAGGYPARPGPAPAAYGGPAQPFAYHFDVSHPPAAARSAPPATYTAPASPAGAGGLQLWKPGMPVPSHLPAEYLKAAAEASAASGRPSLLLPLPPALWSAHAEQAVEFSKAQNEPASRDGRRPSYVDYFIPPDGAPLQSNFLPPETQPQGRIAPPPAEYLPPSSDPVVPPPGDYLPPPEPPADQYLPPPPKPPADEYLPPPPPVTEPSGDYLPPPPQSVAAQPLSDHLPPPQPTGASKGLEYLYPSRKAPLPSLNDQYLPPLAEPANEYLPPPKEPVSPPADEYLPPPPPADEYLPPPPPSDEYLPPPPPSDEYLPPPPPSDEYLPPPPDPVTPPTDQYLPPTKKESHGGGVPPGGSGTDRRRVDKGNPPGSGLVHLSKKVFQKQAAVSDPADPCLHHTCPGHQRCQEVRVPNSCAGRRCGGWLRVADCVSNGHPTCHGCHADEVCVLRKRCTFSEACPSALQCLSRS